MNVKNKRPALCDHICKDCCRLYFSNIVSSVSKYPKIVFKFFKLILTMFSSVHSYIGKPLFFQNNLIKHTLESSTNSNETPAGENSKSIFFTDVSNPFNIFVNEHVFRNLTWDILYTTVSCLDTVFYHI